MMVTIGVLVILAATGYMFVSRSRTNTQAAGERILSELQRIVQYRHAQTRQLNTATRVGGTSLEQGVTVYDIKLDFGQLDTTRTLVLDGVDANNDGRDDFTGQDMATWSGTQFQPKWTGSQIQLPSGWRFALSQSEMAGIPLIAGGQGTRGIPARCVSFGINGSIYPAIENTSTRQCSTTDGFAFTATRAAYFSRDQSPFYAIYAVFVPSGSSVATAAVALAVYQSGYTETFRWDGSNWVGYNARVVPST